MPIKIGTSGNDTLIGHDAGDIELISTNSTGAQGDGDTTYSDVSADGRFVAMAGTSTNFSTAAGASTTTAKVYLKDLATGEIRLVSQSASGVVSDGNSSAFGMSADGNKVLFYSNATNLGPVNSSGQSQLYVKDMVTGSVTLITANAAGESGNVFANRGVISEDGSFVFVSSFATNLGNGTPTTTLPVNLDIYFRALPDGQLTYIPAYLSNAPDTGRFSDVFDLSSDGHKLLFSSRSPQIVGGDYNGAMDLFVMDLTTGGIQAVTLPSGSSSTPSGRLSADGSMVIFQATATGLSYVDGHGVPQVYIKYLNTGIVTQISHNYFTGQAANLTAQVAGFSPDNKTAYFYSKADNLVAGDTNGARDVFAYSMVTGELTKVTSGNGDSYAGTGIGSDALIFTSLASNIVAGDTNGKQDVFLKHITGNDTLSGGDGDDHILGKGGDDVLTGGHGNDTIDGGDGNDTAVFSGARIDYTVTQTGDTFTLVNAIDGTDAVTGVEQFRFADRTLSAENLLNFSPNNHDPIGAASATLAHGAEDTPYVVSAASLLQGFSDADNDTLQVVGLTATQAIVSNNGNGTFTLTPAANYNGPIALTYSVIDSQGGLIAASQTVVLDPVNDAPLGSPTTLLSVFEDTSQYVWAYDLLRGFRDYEADHMSVTNLTADHATFTLVGPDMYSLVPEANYNGPLQINYTVSDGHGGTIAATLNSTVTAVNDWPTAGTDNVSTIQDTVLTINATTLLANDSDADGDTLSIMSVEQNWTNTVTMSGGVITYTPTPGFVGLDSFRYTVGDGHGGAMTTTVYVDVTARPNQAPHGTPTANLAHGTEDTAYVVAASDLVQGLTDTDGDALTVTGLTASHATVVNNGNGTFTLTPALNYNGPVSLRYTVSDGYGGELAATQTLVIDLANDAPTGSPLGYLEGTEDTPVTVSTAWLLNGFSDIDGDTLSVSGISADHASVAANGDGTFTITPDANYNQLVPLHYTISDGHGGTLAADRLLYFAPVNDLPTGSPTAVLPHGTEDTSYTITAASLLQGFSDADGSGLSVTRVWSPDGVLIRDNGNGTFTLTPAADFNGAVRLNYSVIDTFYPPVEVPASVTITFDPANDAPTAWADSATTQQNTPLSLSFATLLANDADPDGDALTITGVNGASNGTVTISGSNVVFTPTTGLIGPASFGYDVSDGHGGTSHANVSLNITPPVDTPTPGNLAPQAQYDVVFANKGSLLELAASTLLANDSDANLDPLKIISVDSAYNGSVSLSGDKVLFAPTPGQDHAGFNYTISDGHGATSQSYVALRISDNTFGPVGAATNRYLHGTEDTPYIISEATLLAGFSSPAGYTLSAGGVNVTHATTVNNGNGTWTVTPAANYANSGVVFFKVLDGHGGKIDVDFGIDFAPVNDAPTGKATTVLNIIEDKPLVVTAAKLTTGFIDTDKDVLSVSDLTGSHVTVKANADGSFTLTPDDNYNGPITLSYTVSDGHGGTIAASLNGNVTPVNDAPWTAGETATTAQNVPVTLSIADLLSNDLDVEGDSLTLTAVKSPSHGTAVISGGNIIFTPALNYSGSASFGYEVSDGHGGKTMSYVTIEVLPIGTAGDDILKGQGLADTLNGLDGNDALYGYAGDDVLNGGTGNDKLDGATGADAMSGGTGNDTYYVDDLGDTVTEALNEGTDIVSSSITYTLGANLENLTLTGTAAINGTGNELANAITGNAGNNILTGGAGDDVIKGGDGHDTLYGNDGLDKLDGGLGADDMAGGAGNDSYTVDNLGDTVTEALNEGTDSVSASVSFTLGANIETLTLTGTAAIDGTGNDLNNTITGNAGNNVLTGGLGDDVIKGGDGHDTLYGGDGNDKLDGGLGADDMSGGIGNDSYTVDNAGDTVSEGLNAGTDSVSASVSFVSTGNIEKITLTGAANIDATGDSVANTITGNAGNNTLSGGDGIDTITGGAGSDRLIGGAGNDILTGGLDGDTFVLSAAGLANGTDTIKDFVHGTDHLEILASDYGFASGHVLTASEFTTGTVAAGASAQFVWNGVNHTLYWDADGAGGSAAVALAVFTGSATVTSTDIWM